MKFVVVDTNVLVVANADKHKSPQATDACIGECAGRLKEIIRGEGIVLDDNWRILDEYGKHLQPKGQPGLGDFFYKWVLNNQANVERVERVSITPHEDREFAEFPGGPALMSFDNSDRKFVAVALASKHQPPILNAVDSDWWDHRNSLRAHGVTIEFLCGQPPPRP